MAHIFLLPSKMRLECTCIQTTNVIRGSDTRTGLGLFIFSSNHIYRFQLQMTLVFFVVAIVIENIMGQRPDCPFRSSLI